MKRVILSLTAVAVVAVMLSSCTKDKTYEEMLTNSKGWKLEAATSSPSYELLSGDKITSLFDGYLRDYELDDILIFNSDGALTVDPGKKLPPAGEDGWKEKRTIGTWKLTGEELPLKLTMKIPFWYVEGQTHTVNVTTLEENTLKYNVTFTEEETGIQYTFSLTYTLNK